MTKLGSGALAAYLLVGCSSESPPGANVGLDKTLPDSALAQLQDVSLIRTQDDFILAGYDSSAAQVRWGRLSLDGVLTQEASFAMAPPVAGPVFAATRKTTAGDQLVAIAVVNSAMVGGAYDLTARVHTTGAPAPAAPVVLNSADSFPAGTDVTKIALAAGAAASGNVGFVAWGTRVKGKPIFYTTLPADAAVTAPPLTFLGDPEPASAPEWDCLAAQERSNGWSFGAVTPNPKYPTSDFQTIEVDELGGASLMTYELSVMVKQCQIIGTPTPAGSYFIALKGTQSSTTAIDFATYYPPVKLDGGDASGTVTTRHPVLPAALYGDPLSLPNPTWVASAGGDIVIGLSRRAGNQVVRYRYDAVRHGSTLALRSADGNSGPMAAFAGDDATYVTYADEVKTSSGTATKRYFMRIDSPASLP